MIFTNDESIFKNLFYRRSNWFIDRFFILISFVYLIKIRIGILYQTIDKEYRSESIRIKIIIIIFVRVEKFHIYARDLFWNMRAIFCDCIIDLIIEFTKEKWIIEDDRNRRTFEKIILKEKWIRLNIEKKKNKNYKVGKEIKCNWNGLVDRWRSNFTCSSSIDISDRCMIEKWKRWYIVIVI